MRHYVTIGDRHPQGLTTGTGASEESRASLSPVLARPVQAWTSVRREEARARCVAHCQQAREDRGVARPGKAGQGWASLVHQPRGPSADCTCSLTANKDAAGAGARTYDPTARPPSRTGAGQGDGGRDMRQGRQGPARAQTPARLAASVAAGRGPRGRAGRARRAAGQSGERRGLRGGDRARRGGDRARRGGVWQPGGAKAEPAGAWRSVAQR